MVEYTISTHVDGDVLKVFWSYCSEVGFIKVPHNNERCIWVRGFLLTYIPVQFPEYDCIVKGAIQIILNLITFIPTFKPDLLFY